MGLTKNEQKALSALKDRIAEAFDVREIRLFGSKARGESSFESDVDVMLKLKKTSPEIESGIDDIVFGINLAYDTFISTVIFSEEEIEEGPMSESPRYKRIQIEGIPL